VSQNVTPDRDSVSLLSDIPAREDILDYQDYRDALVSVIKGFTLESPLTVGVFGDWGSGKTTLLELMDSKLTGINTQTIWVNVWRFGNEEDIWAAFLQSLLFKTQEGIPLSKRVGFSVRLLGRRVDWQRLQQGIPMFIVRLAVVLVPLLLSIPNLVSTEQSAQSLLGPVAAGAGTLLGVILGWYVLLQPYAQAIKKSVNIDPARLVKASPLKDRVSVLEEFRSYFEDVVKSLLSEDEQLVVFIDDIDRCSPERIVQILDAIKLFLDVPRCIYVMGLDRDIVEQAVREKFADYTDPPAEARKYLEKIIVLPFELPPLSSEQMQTLVGKLHANLPEAERSTSVFALGQEPNPRKVKRTINVFLLVWALAQGRDELGDITACRLAKVVVIQQSYRDLYSILSTANPTALGELELYFRYIGDSGSTQNATEAGSDSADEEGVAISDSLKPFTANERLQRLLTLYDPRDEANTNDNFTVWRDGKYEILPEEEMQPYIGLTRSVRLESIPSSNGSAYGDVSYTVSLSEAAAQEINTFSPDTETAIYEALNRLKISPYPPDRATQYGTESEVHSFQGGGLWELKLASVSTSLRIMYRVDDDFRRIEVLSIQPLRYG
jgi:hypothetical protein